MNANQVTFNGVPINPPVTAGIARVFRITNVRANVAGLGGGGLAGTTQLLASISISGSTSLPVNNPVQIAGFIQAGLTTSASQHQQHRQLVCSCLSLSALARPPRLQLFSSTRRTSVPPLRLVSARLRMRLVPVKPVRLP